LATAYNPFEGRQTEALLLVCLSRPKIALAEVWSTVERPREGMAATRCLHPILYPWQVHPHVQNTRSQSIVTLTGTGERWNVAHSSLGMLPVNRFE
jgi:hypothetical protein